MTNTLEETSDVTKQGWQVSTIGSGYCSGAIFTSGFGGKQWSGKFMHPKILYLRVTRMLGQAQRCLRLAIMML